MATRGLGIGVVAERTGLAVSAVRYYEDQGLVHPGRNAGGQRAFERSDIRRLSFVRIAQGLGFSIAEIRAALAELPEGRTPTKSDWERISNDFGRILDARIAQMQALRRNLDGCIGCGCLSLERCKLYNPEDRAAKLGQGPRFLLGDTPSDAE
ncbi:redox-sensitive transcriptional activator SoxR [Marinovum sp. 2_MG-2023]|uniref:redox-sensitive transcriptional activator SoxR n=1 Tax=Roseobacteraceae TaxID=2854170 RepID=UPI001FD0AF52|nr:MULTISPECIES: redox-sensitive transcriptional activator SoxR [Roseobacteraceae]MCJ7873651.1 redox-sensitive transcriptional activator SoxR [Phaeobacter sp. J2-8]MDO6730436.1 redox-sensitive transcriptional activator SoxR [Marinovum sp. 2_MG-2023]MDO6778416.1 redox-sensitive transcriptional activator SoxR [Marinovum sp. 1_MG-2023]